MTDTLSFCVHGIPIKFNTCRTCDDANGYIKLEKRMDKLEDYMKIEDRVTASDILLRLASMDTNLKRLNELTNRITEDDMRCGKTPYKCPVCDGFGKLETPDTIRFDNLMQSKSYGISGCHCCEGKGIVWG